MDIHVNRPTITASFFRYVEYYNGYENCLKPGSTSKNVITQIQVIYDPSIYP